MKDLRKAIEDVLQDSWICYDDLEEEFIGIDLKAFNILVAEFNIHFVEPQALYR